MSEASPDPFGTSRATFESLAVWLGSDEAAGLQHAALEAAIVERGRDLLRQLHQDQMDLRAARERDRHHAAVVDAAGICHGRVEPGQHRQLATVVGTVTVERLAYRAAGALNLYPADALLNLPVEKHSHGLRRLAALEAARGSYDDATEAIQRNSGQRLGKRQVEDLVGRAAVDFDSFYETRRPPAGGTDLLVISADGKGVVMLPESLRPATAAAAASSRTKLQTRLSKGEKRNRKRMATVGAVYDAAPACRSPADILPAGGHEPARGPVATNKWLTASIIDPPAAVIATLFDETDRRDPHQQRARVALVDGNNHQIALIHAEAAARGLTVPIVCDFIHVLEYLWRASWCFHDEGDPDAETWVRDKAHAVLNGQASLTAAAIRRTATRRGLEPAARVNADRCADYLLNKKRYLDYPTALTEGWPIATGVIEGACRHLICDRLDITGARWSHTGAEAILKLRAIHSNGDFDNYWNHHLTREHQRTHLTRYADQTIPAAA